MSLDTFAAQVTSLVGLADWLRQAARSELGATVDDATVESRANRLLVETMLYVGIAPQTERVKRELLFSALRGTPLRDDQTMKLIEYLVGQMIAKPKGALGERLARLPCTEKIQELQQRGAFPPETQYLSSIWSQRISGTREDGTVVFSDWCDGADGVICCHRLAHEVRDPVTASPLCVASDAVFILGVVEVKARRSLAPGEPQRQLDKHVARLTAGLQTRDSDVITTHYRPEQLYFARWQCDHFEAIAVKEARFRIEAVFPGHNEWLVRWSTAVPVLKWAIGPRLPSRSRGQTRFDGFLPYSAAELEQFGNDVMHYTLGAMGDDSNEVDLPGSEWGWNLERLLDCVDTSELGRSQLVRLKKLLSWLRGAPWAV